MKARELAKILMDNPEAEVVLNDNESNYQFSPIACAETFYKDSYAESWQNDDNKTISENEKFNVDVIVCTEQY